MNAAQRNARGRHRILALRAVEFRHAMQRAQAYAHEHGVSLIGDLPIFRGATAPIAGRGLTSIFSTEFSNPSLLVYRAG